MLQIPSKGDCNNDSHVSVFSVYEYKEIFLKDFQGLFCFVESLQRWKNLLRRLVD